MKRIGLFLLVLTLFFGANAANSTIDMDSLKNEIIKTSKEMQEIRKDSIILSKLTNEQLMDIKKNELALEKIQVENDGRDNMPFTGFQLFLVCLLPFLFVGFIIYFLTRSQNKATQLKHDLYMKSLEMGQTVPEHFFDEPKKANPSSNLKKGILWFAVGFSIVIYFVIMKNDDPLILGIVPTFVGLGYLIVHFLDKPKKDTLAKNDEQHG